MPSEPCLSKGRPIHFGSLDTALKREISTQRRERYGESKAAGTEVRGEDRIYHHWERQARPPTSAARDDQAESGRSPPSGGRQTVWHDTSSQSCSHRHRHPAPLL